MQTRDGWVGETKQQTLPSDGDVRFYFLHIAIGTKDQTRTVGEGRAAGE